jgi:formylglycine-generating enzyme required for sulfatase activity
LTGNNFVENHPSGSFMMGSPDAEQTKTGIYYLQEVPAPPFMMGSPYADQRERQEERPQHKVTVQPFQIGRLEVTFDEYDVFSHLINNEGGCADDHAIHSTVSDEGWGRGQQPVVNVSWEDAVCYAQWLSKHTGKPYRLPSEAEWEYAARAGADTAYWWGDEIGYNRANCFGCGSPWDGKQTAPVGSFPANRFGLHDTAGNVWEWVADCWHDNYQGAPSDGSAWEGAADCNRGVRGGSWYFIPHYLRSAFRLRYGPYDSYIYLRGFRLARAL